MAQWSGSTTHGGHYFPKFNLFVFQYSGALNFLINEQTRIKESAIKLFHLLHEKWENGGKFSHLWHKELKKWLNKLPKKLSEHACLLGSSAQQDKKEIDNDFLWLKADQKTQFISFLASLNFDKFFHIQMLLKSVSWIADAISKTVEICVFNRKYVF